MAVTFRPNQMKLKTQDGTYTSPVIISDTTVEEHVAQVEAALTAAAEDQMDAIEAKGEETLESIPDDYTELAGDVADLKNAIAEIEPAVNVLSNPVETETSAVASFDAPLVEPMEITCSIVPDQTGTGDPSPTNIRPINAISSISISHSGDDLSDPTVTLINIPTEAGTVYGGDLVINPDGSADFIASVKLYTLDGTESWYYTGSAASRRIFYTKIGNEGFIIGGINAPNQSACSHFVMYSQTATGTDASYYPASNASTAPTGSQIRIRCGLINGEYLDTVNDFKAWLAAQYAASTPVQCTVVLASPTVYHFNAEEIATLQGTNNVWQNHGNIAVKYNTYYSTLGLTDNQRSEVKAIAVDRIPWEYAIDHVICIGDSLTYGSPADSSVMPYPISQNYPHYLSRFLRCDCVNAGTPNYSAKTWYNTNYGEYDMTQYNAFIIFLGTNGGLTNTLDTDVNPYADYNDFADTQTGYYCRLIEHIKADRPNAIIMLINTWHVASGQPETRATIDAIGQKYGLPVVETYDIMRYAVNPVYHGGIDNVHCSKAGYLALANLVRAKLIDYFGSNPNAVNLGMS